jgi:Ras GTPase-activating-like protein IQGAP2/3
MSINTFVEVAIKQMGDWFLEGELATVTCTVLIQRPLVANVDSAETQYHAHEFLDATVQPKPIYISPNEVYAMHGLLLRHLDALVCFWTVARIVLIICRLQVVMIRYIPF